MTPIPSPPTFLVRTLGCKVNQFESAAMARMLYEAGYRPAPDGGPADLTIINTCTVTHKADFEARNLIRRAHRANPEGRTVVTGCLAQLRPEKMAELPGVVLVLGHDRKAELVGRLENTDSGAVLVGPPGAHGIILDLGYPSFDRTRAFFRIQDGCDARCSYCTVPAARGPSRSLPSDRVIQGTADYTNQGYAEIVLTGIHLGAWGLDLEPRSHLEALLPRLLDETPRARIRLSSIEPNELTGPLVRLVTRDDRICPHLHLPLQSGSDRTLRAMRRPYTGGLFETLVLELAGDREDLCIGADILVGFPGEDEAAFAETRDLVARLPLAYFHVFPYSKRPGTRAADMPGQVHDSEKKRRAAALRGLGREKRTAFFRKNLGRVRPTLIENTLDKATGLARGLTDNYIRVLIQDTAPPAGGIAPVRLERLDRQGRMIGRAVK